MMPISPTKLSDFDVELYFRFNGNQRVGISDYGSWMPLFYGNEGILFQGTEDETTRTYDANGNTLFDLNSDVYGIRYNVLNLPDTIQFNMGHQTNYTYSATGAKLRVTDKTAIANVDVPFPTTVGQVLRTVPAASTTVTDYIDNCIYEDGVLKTILLPEGYWQGGRYHYYLKDHLGSNRVVLRDDGQILERNHYYPSGQRFGESIVLGGSVQPYRHTGHEMQAMHGLNWIDNGARMRTAYIPEFTTADPLCEKRPWESPYCYAGGDPMRFVDPDGMEYGDFLDEKGNVIGNDGIDDKKVYAMKTTQTNFDSEAKSAGISKKVYKSTVSFIKENSGNSDAFKDNNSAYSNSVEIEGSQDTRQSMLDAVSQDNGNGGTSANNNREYGGAVDINGNVTVATPGDVANPSVQSEASVVISTTSNTNSTFHSHPSGTIVVGGNSNSSGSSTSIGGTTTTYSFVQAPSRTDISNAGSHTGYVFGKSSNTVYIYNNSGVVATIPMNRFVNFKR